MRLAGFPYEGIPEQHWTELARRSWPARRGIALGRTVVPAIVGGLLAWQTESLVLTLSGADICYGVMALVAVRIARVLIPGFGWGDFFRAVRFRLVHPWSSFCLPLIFAPLCSTIFDLRTVAVLMIAAITMVVYFRYGVVALEGLVGSHRQPSERLRRIVSSVAARMQAVEPRVYVLRYRGAQAFAYLGANTITVSEGAIAHLSDEQLEAIVAHEIGHLQEPRTGQLLINLSFAPLAAALAAYRPIVEQYNLAAYAVVAIGCWLLAGFIQLPARGMEPEPWRSGPTPLATSI